MVADTLDAHIKRHLPESVLAMIEVLGLAATLELVKQCGGQRLFIPKTATDGHALAATLGMETFAALCAAYPSTMLGIPRCLKALLMLRDAQLLQDHRGDRTRGIKGLTLNACAAKYGMTERGVSKALRRIEGEELKPWFKEADTVKTRDGQVDLFGMLEL